MGDGVHLEMSRRKLLSAGVALGVTASVPSWTWAAAESVAGVGDVGIPPWEVWDDQADPVIAAVIDRGQAPKVNALLREWKTNGESLPDGLPSDLSEFIERAKQPPEWLDIDLHEAFVRFFDRRRTYFMLAGTLGAGMLACAIPHEARAVYYSKGGSDMKGRAARTGLLSAAIGASGAYSPTGGALVAAVKVRMAHAGVRHLLPQSPYWSQAATEIGARPISQRDMLVTWHSSVTTAMRLFRKWGVRLSPDERAAYLHAQQVGAYTLGIQEQYIPASWDAAESQAQQILDPVYAPTEEGQKIARMLVEIAAGGDDGLRILVESLTRHFIGHRLADMVGFRSRPSVDGTIAASWRSFVQFREGSSWFLPRQATKFWGQFDAILHGMADRALTSGPSSEPPHTEIPVMNNPNVGTPSVPDPASPAYP